MQFMQQCNIRVRIYLIKAHIVRRQEDSTLVTFGQQPLEYFRCYTLGQDIIDHIFAAGNFGKNIWGFFAALNGIAWNYTPIRNLFMRWWSFKGRNEANKLVFQSNPIFVCQNLWKNRCGNKYGGKFSNISEAVTHTGT